MDDNGDSKLDKTELMYGLRNYGITLSSTELDQVFSYFDRYGDGSIDLTEFLVGLRGELNERRRTFIRLAFNILDTDKSGIVTSEEIISKYDFNHHLDVRSGKILTNSLLSN